MDVAVVEDQYALRSRIRIHNFKQPFKPFHDLLAIISASFDVGIDQTIHRNRRKE
jgi:hypothetical protein